MNEVLVLVLSSVENPRNSNFPLRAVEKGTESPVYAVSFGGSNFLQWENKPEKWAHLSLERMTLPSPTRGEPGEAVLLVRGS